MPDTYSNKPNSQYLVRTRFRPTRPYIAGAFSNQLTYKERLARQQQKTGSLGAFGGYGVGSGSFGGSTMGMGGMGNTVLSSQGNFFSPQLSTDFLELPQSLRERREIYRHFYNSDELVGQAIDLHTELPLSKVRLAAPKPRKAPQGFKSPENYGKYILDRFERMCKRVKLFQRLITMVHHFWLDGMAVIFAEDGTVEVPPEVGHSKRKVKKAVLTDNGEPVENEEEAWVEDPDIKDKEFAYYQKHYKGWEKLIVLPIDKVKITTFNFTDKSILELIPSDKDRQLIEMARMGDPVALKLVQEIPEEVRTHIEQGQLIPLGTDPDEGSFAYVLTGSKSADSSLGQSILNRCHIAGTPVLAKRGDRILQVLIEDLDPDADLVLSDKGFWREFEVGVRHVSEEITLLHVAKLDPIGVTSDHSYPVLRDGVVIKTRAGDIQPGDYLRVSQIELTETISSVDLADFLEGLEGAYEARKSGGCSTLRLRVVDKSQTALTVSYEKEQTDPKIIGRTRDVNGILEWAATLTEPVTLKSAEICERFNLHPVTLKEIRRQLVELGYGVTVTKGKSVVFVPNTQGLKASTQACYVKQFPRHLKLDGDFGYFLGFWLGDGHIAKQKGLDYGNLGFTYGPNEAASVAAMERIKLTLGHLKVAWSETPTAAGVHLSGCQDALVRWIAANFGHTSEDKHLPGWTYETPREFLLGILRGFCDSDGDVVRKKDGSLSVRFSNTNVTLMEQVFLLCTSLGIPASKTKPSKERWVKQANGALAWAKPLHAVHFTHGPSVKDFFESGFLAKRQEPESWKDGRSGSRHVIYEGSLYYRVSRVLRAHHEGSVYSLNVHHDHTFYAGNLSNFNCLRTLNYREKLRQAQTSIASRAMTPKRIVWAEGLSDVNVDELREQVDLSLVDPDFSIVANYEVHWEEMGSKDRLLDLSVEYEQTERRLLAGLGVTESLMSGESLYSGDRLKLEVINQRYLHLREILQEYVEEYLFRPVAQRMGFVEEDEWGQEVVLFPKLSFTRLPLRDSQDTFDALYNLYSKGSISIDLILELLNIDPNDTRVKIERDMLTVNDALFNEILRSLYNEVGRMLGEKTDVLERIAQYMNLKLKPEPAAEEGGGRFG